MNTTTTTTTKPIQEGALILINEYNEVKTALFEITDNLEEAGRDRSILSDILSDRYQELFRMIWAYFPDMTMDETMDLIAGFETA